MTWVGAKLLLKFALQLPVPMGEDTGPISYIKLIGSKQLSIL